MPSLRATYLELVHGRLEYRDAASRLRVFLRPDVHALGYRLRFGLIGLVLVVAERVAVQVSDGILVEEGRTSNMVERFRVLPGWRSHRQEEPAQAQAQVETD